MNGKEIYNSYLRFAREAHTLLKRYEVYLILENKPAYQVQLQAYQHNLAFIYIKNIAAMADMRLGRPTWDTLDDTFIGEIYPAIRRLTLREAIPFYQCYAEELCAFYAGTVDHRLYELDFKYLQLYIGWLQKATGKLEDRLLRRINLSQIYL